MFVNPLKFDAPPFIAVFLMTLGIFKLFWFTGLGFAIWNKMATPGQMIDRDIFHGMPWVAHFGFWYLLVFLQPVLAWATAAMWPHWQSRAGAVALCMILGGIIGFFLQLGWSRMAVSSDAWSTNGLPNESGIIHILHMSFEIGIMLMLLLSYVWWREMPTTMFAGLLCFAACHAFIGITHWPLHAWYPDWHPTDMAKPLADGLGTRYAFRTTLLTGLGLLLLILF